MAKKQPNLAKYLRRILEETKDSFRTIAQRARARGHHLAESYVAELSSGSKNPDYMSVETLKALAIGIGRPVEELLVAVGLLSAENMVWRVPTMPPEREPIPASGKGADKPKPKRRRKRKKIAPVLVILEEPPRRPIGFVHQEKKENGTKAVKKPLKKSAPKK